MRVIAHTSHCFVQQLHLCISNIDIQSNLPFRSTLLRTLFACAAGVYVKKNHLESSTSTPRLPSSTRKGALAVRSWKWPFWSPSHDMGKEGTTIKRWRPVQYRDLNQIYPIQPENVPAFGSRLASSPKWPWSENGWKVGNKRPWVVGWQKISLNAREPLVPQKSRRLSATAGSSQKVSSGYIDKSWRISGDISNHMNIYIIYHWDCM